MLSPFGIDHGEVSKARVPRKFRFAPAASTGAPTGPQKIKGALNRVGEADISLKNIGQGAGRGIRNLGGALEKRPGLTGTALVGGGGAAGYKYLSDKQPRKKR